ncbi:hypothetical protein RRG08_000744 [Elysia crispata]|uniref:Uncharacterized protein n=1 Tax=Elysia crispata TaxID=231223 RepID=A0AAE0YDC4_9GAST|nr:hypothetical protein RRG08_000744 [Elysia crispata]
MSAMSTRTPRMSGYDLLAVPGSSDTTPGNVVSLAPHAQRSRSPDASFFLPQPLRQQ